MTHTTYLTIKKVHKAKLVRRATSLLLTLFVGVIVYLSVLLIQHDIPLLVGLLINGILLTVIGLSYAYAPQTIALSEQGLVVKRGWGQKFIPYTAIAAADCCPSKTLLIRLCGVGGLFAFTGWFQAKGLGTCFAYVGDNEQMFSVRLKSGKTYVFSCTDRESVVALINKKF